MCSSTPVWHRRPRAAGFTLVELLVVIGIIAVLIGILLPSLQGARRSAAAVKCASSLRQIGMAYNQYAIDNKNAWPIAVFKTTTPDPSGVQEHRWNDMIAKYLTKLPIKDYNDITKLRLSSVLWGCPSYDKSFEYNDTVLADRVWNGYGMNYYTKAPVITTYNAGTKTPGNLAYIDYPASSIGTWWKVSGWTHPAVRGLIADSNAHLLQGPGTFSRTTGLVPPYNAQASGAFYVDARRHLSSNTPKQAALNSKRGINMLFCDGHVSAVTAVEAWNATRGNPGTDTSLP
jgi:prepilin-type N-terminal cleavage/methylation domain-containing protein/prepilin-type processing-associated H-X9-DG protein